ncbi:hypothetical protein M3S04_16045 [Xanthomonas sp. PPL139]|uniref:hypothetical protein n=1 Tax=unclassified Xanthomonas TaxID=2643310 RepID=UPI00339E71B7
MDTLSFIAELIKSLAWPLAVVVVILLFRSEITALLKTMKRGKVGMAEVEFERDVLKLESSAQALPSTKSPDNAALIATQNPRGAVLDSWLRLEEQIISLAMRKGLTNATARRYPRGSIDALMKSGLITSSDRSIIDSMRELRNLAAHDPDFSPNPDSVVSYLQFASDLGARLDQI